MVHVAVGAPSRLKQIVPGLVVCTCTELAAACVAHPLASCVLVQAPVVLEYAEVSGQMHGPAFEPGHVIVGSASQPVSQLPVDLYSTFTIGTVCQLVIMRSKL